MELALKMADSLANVAKTTPDKIRSLTLFAYLYFDKGEKEKTYEVLKEAEELAAEADLPLERAQVLGILSSTHRVSGLTKEGRKYLNKCIEATAKIKDSLKRIATQAVNYHQLTSYDMEEEKYDEALVSIKKSDSLIDLFDTPKYQQYRKYIKAVGYRLTGMIYQNLKQNDSALYYLDRNLEYLEQNGQGTSPEAGLSLATKGKVHLSMGNNEKAFGYLSEALPIAENAQQSELSQRVYKFFREYYKNIEDNKNYIRYTEKYDSVINHSIVHNKKMVDDALSDTSDNFQKTLKTSKYAKGIGYFLLALLLMACVYIVYIRKKRKQEYEMYKRFMDKKGARAVSDASTNITPVPDKEYMPKETEELILKKLKKFEKSQCFLDKKATLTSVSAQLEGNNRYLSYVIKKHKQKDFASYVNELRINYIIDRLKNDPAYLKYKISYLADQCGFSSHTRFTIIFKKVTGIAPSSFIKYLKKENAEKKETA